MIFYENGGINKILSDDEITNGLYKTLEKIGSVKRTLIIPPDITRKHSYAGFLTCKAIKYLGKSFYKILPALGTHEKMTATELSEFFPGIDHNNFIAHNWKKGITELGRISPDFISHITNNKLSFDWPAQINKIIVEENWDLILSVGQVVPHEVVGFANHSKNIFVGTGGEEGLHKSHYIGAVCGLENIMGKINTPVRALLNEASKKYLSNLPIVYILTVIGTDKYDKNVVRGLFIGNGIDCFEKAAALSLKVNVKTIEKPLNRVVVYLDPTVYRSTWLGNKAIYRTRKAIKDGGELIIIAPGINRFGEDNDIDKIIRKYGYCGTEKILSAVENNNDLKNNLCAAAHLIHGSTENRFKVFYSCGGLTDKEINKVGYKSMSSKELQQTFCLDGVSEGFQKDKTGREFYYINNPALGLWH